MKAVSGDDVSLTTTVGPRRLEISPRSGTVSAVGILRILSPHRHLSRIPGAVSAHESAPFISSLHLTATSISSTATQSGFLLTPPFLHFSSLGFDTLTAPARYIVHIHLIEPTSQEDGHRFQRYSRGRLWSFQAPSVVPHQICTSHHSEMAERADRSDRGGGDSRDTDCEFYSLSLSPTQAIADLPDRPADILPLLPRVRDML